MTDPLRPPETDDEPWSIDDELRGRVAFDATLSLIAGIVILALLVYVWIRR